MLRDPPGGVLFPEEERVVANAVAARRRDYTTVRTCARACLERLGYPPVPILPGVGGAPSWPAGVQGSMTHCIGYAAQRLVPPRGSRRSALTPNPTHHFPTASWT